MDHELTSETHPVATDLPVWPQVSWAQPEANAKSKPYRLVLVTAGVALLVGMAVGYVLPHSTNRPESGGAAPSASASANTLSISGTLELVDTTGGGIEDLGGGACGGTGGYSDITLGAQVVISDDAGQTLTISHLESGAGDVGRCVFEFIADVPAGGGYYGVTVTHRGTVKEPESELPNVTVTLGD